MPGTPLLSSWLLMGNMLWKSWESVEIVLATRELRNKWGQEGVWGCGREETS
jgi:hypothetical protein